jgi:hypothetical protein
MGNPGKGGQGVVVVVMIGVWCLRLHSGRIRDEVSPIVEQSSSPQQKSLEGAYNCINEQRP